jgi:hypothetical protein
MISLRRQIGGYCVAVETDCPHFEPLLDEIYRSAAPGGTPQTCFSLAGDPRRWELRWDGEICATGRGEAALFQQAERHLTDAFMTGLERFFQLHAGAVVWDGGVQLLVGDPEAGKTSLVLALAQHGGQILTDEVALLEPKAWTLSAFGRDLIVHRGTWGLFAEVLGGLPLPRWKRFGEYSYVAPVLLQARATSSAPLKRLVFPVFELGGTLRVVRLGQAEVARRVLAQSFNGAAWGGGLEEVAHLAECLPACELRFGDARQAAAQWDALMDLPAP